MQPESLWLVRHAEVAEPYQQVFGGRIDMDLSARGRDQAEALANYVGRFRFTASYASPMKRVQQTLAPLRNNGFPEPIVVPEFREVDFGDWTGHSWEEVARGFGVSPYAWLEELEGDRIANAESGARLRARVEPTLRSVVAKHRGERVAVVCHGGVIRMILSILLELPFVQMSIFEVDYASVTQVQFERGRARVRLHNFTPWRDLS
jgi:broad specificity phosphatase PhoE